MNRWLRYARTQILTKQISLTADTFKALLFMSNSTVLFEPSARFLGPGASSFSTLDEFNGSGYARQTLTTKVVDEDATNDLARWKFDPTNFGNLGSGTRQLTGFAIFKDTGSDATSIACYIGDSVSSGQTFPYDPGGKPVVLTWTGNIVFVW